MKTIILGGAGFIGSNAASRCLQRGDEVVVVDNLSKPGADKNLQWLRSFGSPEHSLTDVRDAKGIEQIFASHRDADVVMHLAGQVAVTMSVVNPREDFESNAVGTFNVLEGMRSAGTDATLIFSSTNKVYGSMDDLAVTERRERYSNEDWPYGISEDRQLDFHSPYGCSKGAADQYVHDYSRIYGIRSVVFRQSCIYGPRQFGLEEQGWIAWFMIAATLGRPITLFGDGKQVRDVLYVDDLLDAFDSAHKRIDAVSGRIYNIGGGCDNTVSLRELLRFLEQRCGGPLDVRTSTSRSGDQKVYVSDIRRAAADLGWQPRIPCNEGLERLYDWVSSHKSEFN